jgi:type IV secretory pathway VirB10-like protein
MSEDFEAEEKHDSGINPIGKYLIYAVVVVVVVATVYGIFHTGVDLHVSGEGSTPNQDTIDLAKLRAEARPKPTMAAPMERTSINLLEPQLQLQASPSPTPQRTPSAFELWREQEALKARDAAPIVAAFEPRPNQTKEIPSLAGLSKLQPPASPWTIAEGSVIQALLMFGVNSDYPGDIVAQLERPLYDSATGRYLLIPAGSKLIGKFARPSDELEERIKIEWHRILLPNNWSMPLPQMPSTDQEGYAGVTGDVNAHHLQKIGAAALLTVLSIGPAIGSAIATSNNQASYYDPTSTIATIMASQAGGQAATHANQWLSPYLNRPKTVVIPPGTRFDVFVNSDLIMPGPYSDDPGQLINASTQR